MKKNAAPELDAAWWRKNLPPGLASAKELDKALGDHAKSLQALRKTHAGSDEQACLKALDDVQDAVKKLQTEAARMLKSPPKGAFDEEDMRNTGEALTRFEKVIDKAHEEAAEEAGVFGDAQRYGAYLKSMLAKLKDGPMSFAFGAATKPEGHRIALHRTASGELLAKRLHDEAGLKKLTFGQARADATDPTTMVLDIEGSLMTGLNAKYKRIRKLFGPLRFERVVVLLKGAAVADEVDPSDPVDDDEPITAAPPQPEPAATAAPDEELQAQLKALVPSITRVLASAPQSKAQLLGLVEACKAQIKGGHADAARQTLDQLRAQLGSAAATAEGQAPAASPQGAVAYGKARLAWQQARAMVRAELERVEKAITEQTHQEQDFDDIEAGCDNLYEVLDELDERLSDRLDAALSAKSDAVRIEQHALAKATLAEYLRYVESDELVNAIDGNPFQPVKVRQTLGTVLGAIAATLA
jgi:hypothetical protein